MKEMLITRAETEADHQAVRQVNERAFGRAGEADLVDALRRKAQPQISLVAEVDGRVVGHIFFSPVLIESEASKFTALGLAPMAVLPEFQNQSIGSELVRRGLEACRSIGHDVVVVLGHPSYYPRFGFVTAKQKGLTCEYNVPDEAFMVAELKEGALAGRRGVVKYRPEFNDV
ncbi:MAG TPA: N-acetyltransferase [Pyrinomonadaceae bacterium]|jgi:putative acetyltransferase|nr:N-acetyltransferase [Pyrinomonadaceae bacterium]